jgi:hypothetical protein
MPSPSESRCEWWERRRGAFSAAVLAGYAVAVLLYETATPSWAGDHIGLSGPSLVLGYGPGGLVLLVVANALFWVPRLVEPADPLRIERFRRRSFTVAACVGGAFPIALLVAWVTYAWTTHRS